jgi:CubicO group peptidase (beta-lactamase class C family)
VGTTNASCLVTPGYEGVAAAFERNFREEGELGAAFAVYLDGELIVDLWGGLADRDSDREWRSDTIQGIFSGTKGMAAFCVLVLLDRGALELDAPVARFWPEFARAGKQDITVGQVMSHQAGLPGFRRALAAEDVLDERRMVELLAEQEPLVEPGTRLCYHGFTFAWLVGELVRRVDGRSIGTFFAQDIAKPLGLEMWIGLPPEEEARVALLELAPDWGMPATRSPAPVTGSDAIAMPMNPPLITPESFPWNSREFHAAENAAAGGIGSVRSIARAYACLAAGGTLDGVTIVRPETVALGTTELARGTDPFSGMPMVFGCGFALQTELRALGPPPDAFGHGGAGGSSHGAWPAKGIAFSYAPNHMRNDHMVDPRAHALLIALNAASA